MASHTHRPVATAGVVFGVLLLLGIGLPGLLIAPSPASAAGFALTALLSFGLVLLWRIRVECVADEAGRVLRIVAVRWPLPTTEQVIPFDAIAGVELQHRNAAVGVVLVLHDRQRIALPGGSSGSSSHGETAKLLRSWLRLPQEPG